MLFPSLVALLLCLHLNSTSAVTLRQALFQACSAGTGDSEDDEGSFCLQPGVVCASSNGTVQLVALDLKGKDMDKSGIQTERHALISAVKDETVVADFSTLDFSEERSLFSLSLVGCALR
jgi:hypothetical protein